MRVCISTSLHKKPPTHEAGKAYRIWSVLFICNFVAKVLLFIHTTKKNDRKLPVLLTFCLGEAL